MYYLLLVYDIFLQFSTLIMDGFKIFSKFLFLLSFVTYTVDYYKMHTFYAIAAHFMDSATLCSRFHANSAHYISSIF